MSGISNSGAILVTGGSRGIGRAISLELASKGYDIIFTFNSGGKEAEKTLRDLSALNVKAESFQVDLSSRSQIEVFTKKMLERDVRLFALINNAGIYQGNTLNEIKDEDWEKVIGLNLSAPFYLALEAMFRKSV
jgi:NAD(P)-dependent dehydrogenase (short-subunit alcohol dehydrogenase family)